LIVTVVLFVAVFGLAQEALLVRVTAITSLFARVEEVNVFPVPTADPLRVHA
jgi:hypothetical protein